MPKVPRGFYRSLRARVSCRLRDQGPDTTSGTLRKVPAKDRTPVLAMGSHTDTRGIAVRAHNDMTMVPEKDGRPCVAWLVDKSDMD